MSSIFSETDTQQLVGQTAKDFSDKHIRPHVMEWDESQYFPVELFKKLGALGFMGMLVPEAYSGAGLGYHEYVSAIVEISKVCGSIGLSVAAHNSLCVGHILEFGNETQKQLWLPKLATGAWIGAWGLTEANTGSDALRMATTAVADGDDYIINGSKTWTTHGKSGNLAVILVRTGELGNTKSISAFVVDRNTPGFKAGKKENKLGMRASETTEMIFEDCRVPKSNMLGNEGDGFKQAMKILDGGRISIAALSLGIAKGAFNAALAYSQERHQFGQAIINFQA
ncbi:MAG: acyl-CoA dehydrogenase, partial [Chitinophagaceae bacterium]